MHDSQTNLMISVTHKMKYSGNSSSTRLLHVSFLLTLEKKFKKSNVLQMYSSHAGTLVVECDRLWFL